MLDVARHINKEIQCTGDNVASGIFQELQGYFTKLHSFDAAKADADIAFINDRLNLYAAESVALSAHVDKSIDELVTGAVACATADAAYQGVKLGISIARVVNPFGWFSGSANPNDVLEAIEDLSNSIA